MAGDTVTGSAGGVAVAGSGGGTTTAAGFRTGELVAATGTGAGTDVGFAGGTAGECTAAAGIGAGATTAEVFADNVGGVLVTEDADELGEAAGGAAAETDDSDDRVPDMSSIDCMIGDRDAIASVDVVAGAAGDVFFCGA